MSPDEEFDAAVKRVNGFNTPPSVGDMLALYGLYKQATVGDVSGQRPGLLDPKGRAKYDAWADRKGLSRDEAKRAYVDHARTLGG